MLRSFHASEFPAEQVLATKHGRRITVCLPARNEESTVAQVVRIIHAELVRRLPVVDELFVIDDGSTDGTAAAAAAAGATVISAVDILPEYGVEHGKGQALWRGLAATTGDLMVYCDSDIRNLDTGFILGLVGPLLAYDDIDVVKGFYERPLDGAPGQGGRVTELVARPLIALLFPHLAPLVQPLAGEFAARRDVLESVPFVGGYGVDLGLLIDISEQFGPRVIAQCDLGVRVHRNRSLAELGPQALEIIEMVLSRAGFPDGTVPRSALLAPPGVDPVLVSLEQRPPLCEVPSHRKTA